MSRVGIIAALPAEARCLFKGKTPLNTIIEIEQTLLYVCGMGSTNSEFAAQKLIQAGASHLVSWGTAGALSSVAQPGDLLLPESIQNSDGSILETDALWRQKLVPQLPNELTIHHGSLFQSNEIIVNQQQKLQIYNKTNATAVDMESYAIANVATQKQIPFLVIRSIVDSSDESIPASAILSVDDFGRTKPLSLIRNLLKNPTDLPTLIQLGNHFKQARQTLLLVVAHTGTSLAFNIS